MEQFKLIMKRYLIERLCYSVMIIHKEGEIEEDVTNRIELDN